MKIKIFLLIAIIALITSKPNKAKSDIRYYKLNSSAKLFFVFHMLEDYTIKTHSIIKDNLALEYPMDLIAFSIMGYLLYHLLNVIMPSVYFF
jgi:hypothetical protein